MSLFVSNGILFGVHNGGVQSIYCVGLPAEEFTMTAGRFRSYVKEAQEYVVPVNRTRNHVTAALDWIDEFEAGTWSFHQDGTGAEFSFADYVTAVQFKLTLMDMAH